MILSVVTGTYNRLPLLQALYKSIEDNLPKRLLWELVIVDAGSTDGSLEWLQTLPNCKLITGDLSGAIKAFCDGAKAARGKYVLLANDDITFHEGSIIPAIVYLEQNSDCGAVAFRDNRAITARQAPKTHTYDVGMIYVEMPDGRTNAPYAQVGLFRRWLGDKLNWWGYGEIDARTYGGDALLSARIYEAGYTIDIVDPCKVEDSIVEDELRALNRKYDDTGYHQLYPEPPVYGSKPLDGRELVDEPALRILYLPIYEPPQSPAGRKQAEGKHGLNLALQNTGAIVWEIDYLNIPDVTWTVEQAINALKPNLILAQFHGADPRTNALVRLFRYKAPTAITVNWNGDYWPHGYNTPQAVEMLQWFDLITGVNLEALTRLRARGLPAMYWQIGYEPVNENNLPQWGEQFDVVMMANNNHAHGLRGDIETMLLNLSQTLGINVGLFGDGWQTALSRGNTLYDFPKGRAIYNASKLAISDTIPDSWGFVSNRFFEALASGVTLLQQHVRELDELTGLKAGVHYLEWHTVDDLEALIRRCLADEMVLESRTAIKQHIHKTQSFDARVAQLFDGIEQHASRTISHTMRLVYPGAKNPSGILGRKTGIQYKYNPPDPVEVDRRDGAILLKLGWVEYRN